MTIDELIEKWNSLQGQHGQAGYQRIDTSHPLDFYIGYDSVDNKELILLSDMEVKKFAESKSIEVEIGKRHDSRWSVCFKLIKKDEGEVFTNLCYDLIESSRGSTDKAKGVAYVLERFIKWQRLLQQGNNGLIAEPAIKGLLGELIFLEGLLDKRGNAYQTIEGWMGPNKADRDFIYSDIWYEVKSTDPSSNSIKISSVEQLDSNDTGNLIIMYIEKTSSSERESITLNSVVLRIKNKLGNDIASLAIFDDKLQSFGYIYRKEYDDINFAYRKMDEYFVAENFPRIRRNMLATGITNAVYDLSIASLHEWKLV